MSDKAPAKPQDTFFHSRMFRGISAAELAGLTDICSRTQLKVGNYLFQQFSPAEHVYTVISGALMLERTSQAGRRQVIYFAYPGDFIGFTHTNEFEYSVICLRDAHLQCYPRKKFLEFVDSVPALKANARQVGSAVLAHTLDQLFALGQKKAHERLCFLLEEIAMRQVGANRETIDLIMSRQDIADYLGLTIETVSRAFSKLKADGLISIQSAHSVKILKPDLVAELAGVH